MLQEITGDLRLLLIALIGIIVLIILLMVSRVGRGLLNPGDRGYRKEWTSDNFNETPVAQHIEQHYAPRIRRLSKRAKRAAKLEKIVPEDSMLKSLATRLLIGSNRKLDEVKSSKDREIRLTGKAFFSKKTGPRIKGNTVTLGIRRHGFGHDRHSHELGGNKK